MCSHKCEVSFILFSVKCYRLTLCLMVDLMLSFNIMSITLCVLSIEMSSPLRNVVGVIDMDSRFYTKKGFYCKELGVLKVG